MSPLNKCTGYLEIYNSCLHKYPEYLDRDRVVCVNQHDVDFQGNSGPPKLYMSLDNWCDQHSRPFIYGPCLHPRPLFSPGIRASSKLSPLRLSSFGLKSRRNSGSLLLPGEIRRSTLCGRSGLAMVRWDEDPRFRLGWQVCISVK
jgi:hypothetical protein